MNPQAATIENFSSPCCSPRGNLAAYLDGELSPREELELEMHLAICAACVEELNEQKKLLQALDCVLESDREIELPADFTRVVVTNAESRVSGLRRPQERFKALFVCAALFLLMLLAFGAETRTVINTSARFAEQFLVVGGFVWDLIYDVAAGIAIVLRSLGHWTTSNSGFTYAFVVSFFFAAIFLPRFVTRSSRSANLEIQTQEK